MKWPSTNLAKLLATHMVDNSILNRRDITLLTKVRTATGKSYGFPSSHVQMWEVDHKKGRVLKNWRVVVLSNFSVGEDSWESWLQGDPTSPSQRKSVLGVHWKDWYWSWNPSTLASWCEELTHLKRPWCWGRLKVGGEGDNRGEMVGWITDSVDMS